MRAVNLLTYEHPGVRSRLPAIPKPPPGVAAGIVASVLLLVLGLAYVGALRDVGDRQQELAAVSAKERALVARVEGARNEQALADREQRKAALDAALAHRIAWDRVLRDVARVLPPQVSVTSLSVQAPTAPGAAPVAAAEETGPSGLVLTGVALTQPSVALVLDRLELVSALVGVELQSSTLTTVKNRTARTFTIAAGIRAEGAP